MWSPVGATYLGRQEPWTSVVLDFILLRMSILSMHRIRILLPGDLFDRATEFCGRHEMSLAELCRRSLEDYLVCPASAGRDSAGSTWEMPTVSCGEFLAPVQDWRLLANCKTETLK